MHDTFSNDNNIFTCITKLQGLVETCNEPLLVTKEGFRIFFCSPILSPVRFKHQTKQLVVSVEEKKRGVPWYKPIAIGFNLQNADGENLG